MAGDDKRNEPDEAHRPAGPGEPGPKPPSLQAWFHDWLFSRFGVVGVFTCTIIGGAFSLLGRDVVKLPPIPSVVDWMTRPALPTAKPEHFSIGVAKFANDDNDGAHRRVLSSLQTIIDRDLSGRLPRQIEVRQFPRTLDPLPNGDAAAHSAARALLASSGYQALVWGTVDREGNRLYPTVYWTTSQGPTKLKRSPQFQEIGEIRLPGLAPDLAEVLGLLSITAFGQFIDREGEFREGEFIGDALMSLVQHVDGLLQTEPARAWDTTTHHRIQVLMADALEIAGSQKSNDGALTRAISIYRTLLQEASLDDNKRARLRRNLANALRWLGDLSAGLDDYYVASLEEFRRAEEIWARSGAAFTGDLAAARTNRGDVLRKLGERNSDPAQILKAIALFDDVITMLRALPRDRHWARVQNARGNALQTLAEREFGTEKIKSAIAALQEAERVWTRAAVPERWARVNNNLALAHQLYGERGNDVDSLWKARKMYRDSLELRHRRAPRQWALTKNNEGTVLVLLADRTRDLRLIDEALPALAQAHEQLTKLKARFDVATCNNNTGVAYYVRALSGPGSAFLDNSVAAFQEAKPEWCRGNTEFNCAMVTHNLAQAKHLRGVVGRKPDALESALSDYEAALKVRTKRAFPFQNHATAINVVLARSALEQLRRGSSEVDSYRPVGLPEMQN